MMLHSAFWYSVKIVSTELQCQGMDCTVLSPFDDNFIAAEFGERETGYNSFSELRFIRKPCFRSEQ